MIETNTSQAFAATVYGDTFAPSNTKQQQLNGKVMKVIAIVAACLAAAVALRIFEVLSSRKPIRSVGAKSNRLSKNIATINIADSMSIQEGLKHYKDIDD